MTINNWPKAERPREKLIAQGAKHLSDAELLAIFFRTGVRGKTALDLGRELLKEAGGLKQLLSAELAFFSGKPGIGAAKFAMLKAAIELGRRFFEEPFTPGEVFKDSTVTKRFLASRLQQYEHEVFACLFLNSQNRIICFEELFQGTLNETSVYPREVLKRCLAHHAAKVILSHNHPSGHATPSLSDRELTTLLKEALALIDVQVIDHIVVGKTENFSFVEAGFL